MTPFSTGLRSLRAYEDEVARVRGGLDVTLARYLASGITAVIDVGGPMWNFAVRARAEALRFAPSVAVAGPLLAPYAPPALAADDPPIVRIRTPAEARAEVRIQLAHEPDLIKIWMVLRGTTLEGERPWVRAAIAESHAAGVPVVVHATRRRIARAAIEDGADILAHGIEDREIDDSLLRLMKRRGVIYTTTLMVREGYGEVLGQAVRLSEIERRLGDPDAIASFGDLAALPRALRPGWRPPAAVAPTIGRNLARVHAAGVRIAAGSDAGNIGTLHGPALHRELELMVTEAGLPPSSVLVAATAGGAALMGREAELGTIEAGKRADLVVLDADPLADIRNTRQIHRIVKAGVVHDPADIMAMIEAHRS